MIHQRGIRVLSQLLKASRPEWCFVFAGVVLMLEIYFNIPLNDLWIGILSIFLFGWSHFSLNAFTDKESDKLNPRNFSLRNPFVDDDCILDKKHIFAWITILWLLVFIINVFFTPNPSLLKWTVGSVIFGTAFIVSVAYSIPTFGRFKARPIVDLIATAVIFAFLIPIYLYLIPVDFSIIDGNVIIYNVTASLSRLVEGIFFTILLLLGIHMPTVLGDLEQDRYVNDITTAVWLENIKKGLSYKVTGLLILLRVLGFAIMNIVLMMSAVLSFSILPFFLGITEIYLVIKMLKKQNRQSSVDLWKGIIWTSSLGGILFGCLYFWQNPAVLDHYLGWWPIIQDWWKSVHPNW